MRENVTWLYKACSAAGLIVGRSGNVSARTPEGMVITPSGCDPDTVTTAAMAVVRPDGTTLDGTAPSSEWALHAAIYRTSSEAAFIVHTHADACTALACLGSELPAFHYMVGQFGGVDVRCAPYVTFGTTELADRAAEAMRGRRACLLGNHGMVVYGRNAPDALSNAMLLETLCRQYLLALSAGRPRLLTIQEMTDVQTRFETYGAPSTI